MTDEVKPKLKVKLRTDIQAPPAPPSAEEMDPEIHRQRFLRWALFRKAGAINSVMMNDGTWSLVLKEEPSAEKLKEMEKIAKFKYRVEG